MKKFLAGKHFTSDGEVKLLPADGSTQKTHSKKCCVLIIDRMYTMYDQQEGEYFNK